MTLIEVAMLVCVTAGCGIAMWCATGALVNLEAPRRFGWAALVFVFLAAAFALAVVRDAALAAGSAVVPIP